MHHSNMYGGCCQTEDFNWSKADRKALLKEKEAILEAKLATIRHWIENTDKEKSESDKE